MNKLEIPKRMMKALKRIKLKEREKKKKLEDKIEDWNAKLSLEITKFFEEQGIREWSIDGR